MKYTEAQKRKMKYLIKYGSNSMKDLWSVNGDEIRDGDCVVAIANFNSMRGHKNTKLMSSAPLLMKTCIELSLALEGLKADLSNARATGLIEFLEQELNSAIDSVIE